ncbi:kinase-like domain-containing protein [Glomus cerebriforme]|uniref:Kinase-like domain-containing protein n=1 Tax=Glomus cerebriforme TaxID=658196 RepID=A0A397SHW0_9GLOM|nr:kinase-like domain-containing protein [Glomus cerebriforme]
MSIIFENIEYITKGGFGKIYKAKWDGFINYWDYKNNRWNRNPYTNKVALKSLNNSKDITLEFLNEINLHLKMNKSKRIIKLYGITKDPESSNFMMVMNYAQDGNLRQKLNRNFNTLSWYNKLDILRDIARGLSDIHEKGLTHQDFHSGNILRIIIYEVINGLPPYHDMAHEEFLAIKICHGLGPNFNIKVPQLIVDIFKQYVDADPSKRPTAKYLTDTFWQWGHGNYSNTDSEIYKIKKQIEETDEFNEKQPSFTKSDNTELTYTTHPQAIYTSRLLNFNNLPEPKNAEFSGN